MYPYPRVERDALIDILCMMMLMGPDYVVSSEINGMVEMDKMPRTRDL
jgi:hypothetical protein